MTESLRNEVMVTFGGREYPMRATFACVRLIERELGRGIIAAVAQASQLTVSETVGIIYHGIKAADPDMKLSVDEVGNAVLEDGVEHATSAVLKFMLQVMNGVSTPGKPVNGKAA